eukprot:TRINITY_DN1187_c1_g3_i1.p2 TRINITY_DN1187_c1_g3~~TRINITY_DN1187_c1_g3_i1.p2  ORF type:complete len:125 (-),score=41.66 TRINITY_DN1187_c1_g3_i1:257-631(-)
MKRPHSSSSSGSMIPNSRSRFLCARVFATSNLSSSNVICSIDPPRFITRTPAKTHSGTEIGRTTRPGRRPLNSHNTTFKCTREQHLPQLPSHYPPLGQQRLPQREQQQQQQQQQKQQQQQQHHQ